MASYEAILEIGVWLVGLLDMFACPEAGARYYQATNAAHNLAVEIARWLLSAGWGCSRPCSGVRSVVVSRCAVEVVELSHVTRSCH